MDQRCAHKKVSLSEMKNAYYSSLIRIYLFLWDFRESQLTRGHEIDLALCTEGKENAIYVPKKMQEIGVLWFCQSLDFQNKST